MGRGPSGGGPCCGAGGLAGGRFAGCANDEVADRGGAGGLPNVDSGSDPSGDGVAKARGDDGPNGDAAGGGAGGPNAGLPAR